MKIKMETKLVAGIRYDKEAEAYVAYAPALRVYAQGENKKQAKVALQDGVESFLMVAYENGVLEKCLKNVGFVIDARPMHKSNVGEEYIEIKEEAILVEKEFMHIFEIPAVLPLAAFVV
jgi:hypothetical protein